MKILIVEDDREIRRLLADYLKKNGFETEEAADGRAAALAMQREKLDVILMDMMLPYRSGDSLIRDLREKEKDPEKRNTPVIVLSAKSRTDTRIEVLRMGADDYIIKPFDLDEVLVRIQVVLRRTARKEEEKELLSFGQLTYEPAAKKAAWAGEALKLTAKELQLLALFLGNQGRTFTKAELYQLVWNDTYYYEDNTINVHMSNLRSKLRKASGKDVIETVWGIGYRLMQREEA